MRIGSARGRLRAVMAITLAALAGGAAPVAAHTLSEGMTAYDRGDYERAAAIFRPLAEDGDTDAKYLLGFMYDTGQGVARNEEQAAFWVRRAALRGFAVAQYHLAFLHATGHGVERDDAEAARWYRRAAEQDHVFALNELAAFHETGRGVPQDYLEAARLYERAIEQGDSELVGWLLLFARPAADTPGHAPAQYYLGRLHEAGHGVKQNAHRAAEWYLLAARQGFAEARYNLGLLHERGAAALRRSDGVPEPVPAFPRDEVRAYAWLELAATGFGEEQADRRAAALAARDRVAAGMSAGRIEAARRLASDIILEAGAGGGAADRED